MGKGIDRHRIVQKALKSLSANRDVIVFCLGFAAFLAAFAVVFYQKRSLFAWLYLKPMTHTAAFLLNLFGIESRIDLLGLSNGFCDLVLEQVAYRVKHECTGLFANSIFLAAVLAYPAGIRRKALGVLMGVPAFFVFGLFRLIIMALVAVVSPAHIELFHVYIMVIVSLGFAVALWMIWLGREHEGPTAFSH